MTRGAVGSTRVPRAHRARIARIAIDPRDAEHSGRHAALAEAAYIAAAKSAGIFRTTDGGKSWKRVLFSNDSSGGIDVVRDPNDPDHLYAALWQLEIHTWGRFSGGAGSGIWQSRDGGATWTRLAGNGLPTHPIGKVGLGVTAANSNRLYALIETGKGNSLERRADRHRRALAFRTTLGRALAP